MTGGIRYTPSHTNVCKFSKCESRALALPLARVTLSASRLPARGAKTIGE